MEEKCFHFPSPEKHLPVLISCSACTQTTLCVYPDSFVDYANLKTYKWYCLNCRNTSGVQKKRKNITKIEVAAELALSSVITNSKPNINIQESSAIKQETNNSGISKNSKSENCCQFKQVEECCISHDRKADGLSVSQNVSSTEPSNCSKVEMENKNDNRARKLKFPTLIPPKDVDGQFHFQFWLKVYMPRQLYVARNGKWIHINREDVALEDFHHLPARPLSYLEIDKLDLIDINCIICGAAKFKYLPIALQFKRVHMKINDRHRFFIKCSCAMPTEESLSWKLSSCGGNNSEGIVTAQYQEVTHGFNAPSNPRSADKKSETRMLQ